jgi:hypothetical protein
MNESLGFEGLELFLAEMAINGQADTIEALNAYQFNIFGTHIFTKNMADQVIETL